METEALEGMEIGEQIVLEAGDQEGEVGTSEAGPQAGEESAPPVGSLTEPHEGLEAAHHEEEVEVERPEDEEEEVDEVNGFYCGKNGIKSGKKCKINYFQDMLFSGVIQCAQKLATQHGACLALTAFWKNSMGVYHENGKVRLQI